MSVNKSPQSVNQNTASYATPMRATLKPLQAQSLQLAKSR